MIACAVIAVACGRANDSDEHITLISRAAVNESADSNIAARDYVGPDACRDCHPGEYAAWTTSLHAIMNARVDEPGAVIADFSGTATLTVGATTATFGPGYAMTLRRGDATRRYRVTRTIGHRALQEFVGVDDRGLEVRLPFGWWPRAGGWAPQPAFDPWLTDAQFDPFAEITEPWAARCPWCHSTYPLAQRIARGSLPRGLGHGVEQWFASAPGSEQLDVAQQITTGISCESCHLGGRAHARAGAPIQWLPRGAALRADAPATLAQGKTFAAQLADPTIANAVCAQCHSGPSPRWPNGAASRNSSEAIDLAASPCTDARCVDCHDPHRPQATAAARDQAANAACVRCHQVLADPIAERAHRGDGHADVAVTCVDCHMPRVVLGIDRHVRSHRISSPADPAMLATSLPNACNLCHLERSLAWTRASLRLATTPRPPPQDDVPAGEQWLTAAAPDLRVLAADAYAARPQLLDDRVRDLIARGQRDPRAYVRAWTRPR